MHDFRSVLKTHPNGFHGAKVLIVGDLMLDVYVYGQVQRISPEAPVPVIRFTHQAEAAGGSANVAINVASLGADASIAGCVGEDLHGQTLVSALGLSGVRTQAVTACPGWSTIRKTRLVGNAQQITRIDHEARIPAAFRPHLDLWPAIEHELARKPGAVILSDYAKGVLTPELCQRVIRAATANSIPVIVDPKGSDYSKYAGCMILTPNLGELVAATGASSDCINDLLAAGEQLRRSLNSKILLVTRGADGMTMLRDGERYHIETRARAVFDVSGAGDTVIGTIAAALAAGIDIKTAVQLGNAAAGIVVGKPGTAAVSWRELTESLHEIQTQEAVARVA